MRKDGQAAERAPGCSMYTALGCKSMQPERSLCRIICSVSARCTRSGLCVLPRRDRHWRRCKARAHELVHT